MSDPAASQPSHKSIKKWELAGFLFIITAGSLLHFVFDWTGGWMPAAVVAAVNESVWEHLKLAFWPGVLFAVIEYRFLKDANNFLVAKTLCLFTAPLAITLLFYLYTALLGRHLLFLDISIFIIAVGLGQYISLRVMTSEKLGRAWLWPAAALLVVLLAAFSLLTYITPALPVFLDPATSTYGIR